MVGMAFQLQRFAPINFFQVYILDHGQTTLAHLHLEFQHHYSTTINFIYFATPFLS